VGLNLIRILNLHFKQNQQTRTNETNIKDSILLNLPAVDVPTRSEAGKKSRDKKLFVLFFKRSVPLS
jgi:hypothetical protein